MIRLIVVFLILFFGVLYLSNSIKLSTTVRKRQYVNVIILILMIQSGLRHIYVGADTYQYYFRFEDVLNTSWSELFHSFVNLTAKDPFYSLFQKIFQLFSESYQVYLLFVAFIFMSALRKFILVNTVEVRHAIVAFLIYMGNFYNFFSITGIRQTLATAFILWSYNFIIKKNILFFILFVIIGSLFHISALIFLPLYFVAHIKYTKKLFLFSIIIFPIVLLVKNQFVGFFINVLPIGDRFGEYAEQYEKGGSIILTLAHFILALVAYSLLDRTIKMNKQTELMFKTFAVAMIFFPLQWVNPNAGRIAQYFTLVMMIWIPFLLDSAGLFNSKKREILYVLTICVVVVFTMFTIDIGEYKFFWEDMELPNNYRKF